MTLIVFVDILCIIFTIIIFAIPTSYKKLIN